MTKQGPLNFEVRIKTSSIKVYKTELVSQFLTGYLSLVLSSTPKNCTCSVLRCKRLFLLFLAPPSAPTLQLLNVTEL